MDNMSLADAFALKNDCNGNGWNGDFFLIILFLFLFNGGFNNGNFGGAGATAAAQNELLLGQNFDRVGQKLDGIANGMCNSTYDLNNSIKDCCCNTQLGIANLGAQLDQQTCAITTAIHGEGDATRAMIRENEIQALRDKVADLQVQNSQCRQNEYLIGKLTPPCPVPAYLTCSPYQSYNPGNCGCGCGNF